jgi:potassium-transporting ATPase KdpC subunit
MTALIRPALLLLATLGLLTGLVYPAVVTALAQLFGAPSYAKLIGQPFSAPGYFWSRPSATTPFAYDASASSGSNLGPSNPALHAAVRARIERLRAADPADSAPMPVDLVTASGSGLDPHITPAAAFQQLPRVARARGLREERLRALVESRIEERTFRLLGERRVNVLLLNRDLDRLQAGGG